MDREQAKKIIDFTETGKHLGRNDFRPSRIPKMHNKFIDGLCDAIAYYFDQNLPMIG